MTTFAPSAAGQTLHVDDDASSGGDGLAWPTAYRFLQDALSAAAASGGTITEIRVAGGVYHPDQTELDPNGTGDQAASFELRSGLRLQGGYVGLSGPQPDDRHVSSRSVLSGDLSDDDAVAGYSDNSYHVLTTGQVDASAMLDGFVVTAGRAFTPGDPDDGGGGLLIDGGSPTIRHCRFEGNSGLRHGGAVRLRSGGAPSFAFCVFLDNSTTTGGGGPNGGGGIHSHSSSLTVVACDFVMNNPLDNGGGMLLYQSDAAVRSCVFTGNRTCDGGALDVQSSTLELLNCTIVDNDALSHVGGGLRIGNGSSVHITNSILWGNADASGTGEDAQLRIVSPSTVTINHSCIQGWTGIYGGVGNIGDDPLLSPAAPRLSPNSPCIDTGDSLVTLGSGLLVDADGKGRIVDVPSVPDGGIAVGLPLVTVDMGAYEFLLPGDADWDWDVDLSDLSALLAGFGLRL